MIEENYYAIRIGNTPHDFPYLKLREGTNVPQIFNSFASAKIEFKRGQRWKIIKVAIKEK